MVNLQGIHRPLQLDRELQLTFDLQSSLPLAKSKSARTLSR